MKSIGHEQFYEDGQDKYDYTESSLELYEMIENLNQNKPANPNARFKKKYKYYLEKFKKHKNDNK